MRQPEHLPRMNRRSLTSSKGRTTLYQSEQSARGCVQRCNRESIDNEVCMSSRRSEFSPRPSVAGYQIGRRGLLKAGAGLAGAAALATTVGSRFASAQLDLGSATGDV